MRILLIRHGLTAMGEQKRYQGSLDLPLSENGRKALQPAAFTPELLAVSPMIRARETAAILFPFAVRMEVIPDLREMDFGLFEGRGWWEMENDAAYRAWIDSGCLSRCPEGEDRSSFAERVCRAFSGLVQDALASGVDTLAVVAHGGTQMAAKESAGLFPALCRMRSPPGWIRLPWLPTAEPRWRCWTVGEARRRNTGNGRRSAETAGCWILPAGVNHSPSWEE